MRPISRINLGLGLTLLLLLALQHWPFGVRPPGLLALRADQVHRIEVLKAGHKVLALQREASGWKLTYPAPGKADRQRVAILLGLLQLPRPDRPIDVSPDKVGLNPPRLRVRFNDSELDFGDTGITGDQRYVEVGGRVYLVKDLAYRIASLPPGQYLDTH